MAITITIDNDPNTVGIQTLVNDQSAAVQTPQTVDTGNDSELTISDATVGNPDPNTSDAILAGAGYSSAFISFLNAPTIFGIAVNDTEKAFAANVDGAVSSSSFITVTTSANETINDLFFSDSSGNALAGQQVAGMTTLDGSNVYLWSNGDYAIATTSATAGAGRVVAAFHLNEAANHLSAQVEMVTFEALNHPVAGTTPAAFDDALNFTDVLQVSAVGSVSFNFDNLPSGNFLYAAVGTSTAGLLVTGQDLNVQTSGNKVGDIITGGSDPSDTVNTSQGGIGATIGINSQHFTDVSGSGGTKVDGAVGVFTLVKNFASFDATVNGTSEGTGSNVNEISYSDYVNAPSAKIFISQSTGSSSIGGAVRVTLWEAGGGSSADHLPSQLQPEEGLTDTANSYSYIGDTSTDSHLRDDTPVAVGSVTVQRGNSTYTWTSANSGVTQGTGIKVTISGNTITVQGLTTSDTLGFAAANDPNNLLDGTFNRFDVQALANSNPVDIGRIDLSEGVSSSHGVGSDLIVQDDGPSITANSVNAPTIQDDESSLGVDNHASYAGSFTTNFGTDGPAAINNGLAYALSTTSGADSGVKDTGTGQEVFLFNVNGTIVGKAGADAASAQAGNTVVFVVSVDQSGNVTLDQQRAIVHSNTSDPNDFQGLTGANKVVLTATATDGDGDHASTPLDLTPLLGFYDDGPSIGPISNGLVSFANDATGTVTHSLNGAVGADPNSVPYGLVAPYTTSITINGTVLNAVASANGQQISYWADTSKDGIFGNTGDTEFYRLTLNESANSGAGSYTFTVLQPPPPAFQEFNFNNLPSGQNLFGMVGTTASALVVIGGKPVLNSDGSFANSSDTINTSQGGGAVTIGVNNQMFDSGESAYFTFVKTPVPSFLSGAPGGLDQNEADNANNIQYTGGLTETNSAFLKVVQIQGNVLGSMDIAASNITSPALGPQGTAFVSALGSGSAVAITAVRVFDSSGNLLEKTSGNGDGGMSSAITITIGNGVAHVSGVGAGEKVAWDTSSNFDQVKVTDTAGKFDIGGFGILQGQDTPDQLFHFTAKVTDGDGDSSTAGWNIGIDGTGIYHDGIVAGL